MMLAPCNARIVHVNCGVCAFIAVSGGRGGGKGATPKGRQKICRVDALRVDSVINHTFSAFWARAFAFKLWSTVDLAKTSLSLEAIE